MIYRNGKNPGYYRLYKLYPNAKNHLRYIYQCQNISSKHSFRMTLSFKEKSNWNIFDFYIESKN